VAVLVDGCFWHGCPLHATTPKANAEFWKEKLAANLRRDRDTDARLKAAGWTVIRVWEHDDRRAAARRISRIVGRNRKRLQIRGARASWQMPR
jgi:DNA mismatch endonuclease (patch repair protein)